jgi:hypothetical protein
VLDPDELDASSGPRATLTIEIPEAWADGACEIEIVAPPKLVCARCDGGGCDGCSRSGAFRLATEPAERTFVVPMPSGIGDGAVLRIAEPFGAGAPPEQLMLRIVPASEASSTVRLLGRLPQAPTASSGPSRAAVVSVVIAAIVALVAIAASLR